MWLSVLGIVVLAYLLVWLITAVVASLAIEHKGLRLLFVIVSLLTPPLAVWVFLKSFLERPKTIPYHEELARIEDEIEAERVSIFGGEPLRPSFSQRWKDGYLRAVAKAANKINSVTGTGVNSSLFAGISSTAK